LIAEHLSVVKEKDLELISWFENCLVGQLCVDGQYLAIGYDLNMVADENKKIMAEDINRKIKDIISK
jgi:hypothetical protein